ncbi:MAG: hypothetical protein CMB32_06820 [Euryarchaeota archaeon]|nr:hypothetical protein [Euryarchaeota archaeon]
MNKNVKIQKWLHPPFNSEKKRIQEGGIGLFVEDCPSRKSWKKAISENRVLIDGQLAKTSTWVYIGSEVSLTPKIQQKPPPSKLQNQCDEKLKIQFENQDIIIIEKPPGISTIGYNKLTLNSIARKYLNNTIIHPAHRLDKDTHGLVIFYKNHKASIWLEKAFKKREINKTYYALVEGELMGEFLEIKTPLSNKPSTSIFTKIGSIDWPVHDKATLVKINPISGRKHQIRKHLKQLGHPIVGDSIYNNGIRYKGHGLFLSCTTLNFTTPEEELVNVEIDLPKKFKRVIHKLDLP